ncbi:hypothetical protein TNCV_3708361 [Trichonephila clavipes]|nr:hypothetical protein TNCV_3708361 [Trichonephila clavipes]
MRARAYCAHPSIRYYWALRCMGRCPDQVVSLKQDPGVLIQERDESPSPKPRPWARIQLAYTLKQGCPTRGPPVRKMRSTDSF